jgi:elongation factor 1-beta
MATAILKLKIMPESPETDLGAIEKKVKTALEKLGAKIHSVEKEPIAFGLVALIMTVVWPEETGTEDAENAVKAVEGVSSVEIIDYRRAFG